MPASLHEITIGELARRSGVATSALRFYESRGLIASGERTAGQRRFARPTSDESGSSRRPARGPVARRDRDRARALPERRTPTKADWAVLSRAWRGLLRSRIEELETLQTRLTSCIGCGCLSLKTCGLLNATIAPPRAGAARVTSSETRRRRGLAAGDRGTIGGRIGRLVETGRTGAGIVPRCGSRWGSSRAGAPMQRAQTRHSGSASRSQGRRARERKCTRDGRDDEGTGTVGTVSGEAITGMVRVGTGRALARALRPHRLTRRRSARNARDQREENERAHS